MTAKFEVKTIPGPTPEERAAKQRTADKALTKARRTYRLSATERHATRRYLRSIAAKGNRPWYATRLGFRAHLAVSPFTLATYCFHRCHETTTGEPTAPLGICRTCLRRWNRAVADAKAMHIPRDIECFDEEAVVCQGCFAADETLPRDLTKAVTDGFDTALMPLWPCAHADETDPLARKDDPKTWRALVEDRKAKERESRERKARHGLDDAAKRSLRKPITDDEY